MKTNRISLILLLFHTFSTFLFVCHEEKEVDCSTTYILPIFSSLLISKCIDFGIQVEQNPCYFGISQFISNCQKETDRRFMKIFDFVFKNEYLCDTKTYGTTCNDGYSIYNTVNLNKTHKYGIDDFFKQQIKNDTLCYNNSIAVFLINIPCSEIEMYLDVDEIFGWGLEKTKRYFLGINMHAYVNWIIDDRSDLEICKNIINNLNYSESNFLKFHFIPFETFYRDEEYGTVCNPPIPPILPLPDTSTKKPPSMAERIAVIITCSVVFALILMWVAFWGTRIRRRYLESRIEAFAIEHAKNSTTQILFGKYRDEWEVTPKELKVNADKILGRGAFGIVYMGHLKKKRNNELIEMDVAVKFVNDNADEKMRKDMISEIGFMKALGSHKNLLVMVGYVKSIENPVICTHFCIYGDLHAILRKHDLHFMSKQKCQEVEICLLLPDLIKIILEICNGLIYLSSLNYIHRDVAARNVLLAENGGLIAKLGDFGLCKKLEINEVCVIDKKGKLPIKHMCYESLAFGEFSLKTDVWSFGILIFEIMSGGKRPFEEVENEDFVRHLLNDGKPQLPETTPQSIVELLNNHCFQKYPSRRYNFVELERELKSFYSIVLSVVNRNM